jgi:UrcA family protein
MTRLNSALVLRRTSERLTAGAAAIAATVLMMLTVQVRATEPEPNPPSISVRYSEGAFTTREQTANVYLTLKIAARKVCGLDPAHVVTLDESVRARECVRQALSNAVRSINRPMLTSVHDASAGKAG